MRLDVALRDDLVARVGARGGRVHLVTGEAGIGKSTLTAEVASELAAAGFSVIPIIGVRESRAIALAAMAPVLALRADRSEAPITERLKDLYSAMSEPGRRFVLAVDDAPWIDDVSASVVFQLVRVYGLRCVMTARIGEELPGPLARLQDEGFVQRIVVERLSESLAAEIVVAALGGRVEPEGLQKLLRRADGNPLFLRELVLDALARQGTRAGRVRIDADALPQRVREGILRRLDDLDDEPRRGAELLAMAEPLPRANLASAMLRALERRELVVTSPDGVRLAHPLFAEVLQAGLSAGQLRERRIEAAALLDPDQDEARFRAISLRAAAVAVQSHDELVWASRYAGRVDDHLAALELGEAALTVARTFEAIIACAAAVSSMGRLNEADRFFREAEPLAATDAELQIWLRLRGRHLAMQRKDAPEAVRVTEAGLARITDPAMRAALAIDVGKWRLLGGVRAAEVMGEAVGADDELNGLLLRAMTAAYAGEPSGGLAAVNTGLSLAAQGGHGPPHVADLLAVAESILLFFDGRIGRGRSLAHEMAFRPLSAATGIWNQTRALLDLHSGHATEALESSRLAIDQLAWRDFAGVLGVATGLHIAAAAALGDAGTAEAARETLTEPMRALPNVVAQLAEAEAWRAAHAGTAAAAVPQLLDAVERLTALGHRGVAAGTAYVGVRIGQPAEVRAALGALAAASSSVTVAVMADHAAAAAEGRRSDLARIARRLHEIGLIGGAVDAADEARRLFVIARDRDAARRIGMAADHWATGLSGYRHGALPSRDGGLTAREWEIVRGAATGELSREIALRLGLSVRTVENHLAHAYTKLGVGNRRQLREELGGLL